ncbi:hypothetical protein LGL55_10615 [Clostridium tagluense]|uniref:hypothetical protein n=1 Tax=Clostridium tagluense TaxID=360422 RepID=UPI001CF22EB2|nr:hypothetical protein [Clostridium tagluense]MCB2311608.1 hypothetical protein [Clostridium tagluense]MCB2316332.1 hypothetical protein [Clostridium tagluense]MCB2321284.1 hypothetical protein [Clostridium tagluense]MCB2326201.1 hypothetical protein [Clostridium tagluense]MCB2331020.1 hypothetical protein [Clostridium tagluense]
MNKLIIDTLEVLGVPVSFQKYSGNASTYITFFNYLENVESYANNEETSIVYYIQVDVWSKDDYEILIKNVLELLKLAGFKRTYVSEMYEDDTEIYHKIIRITKIKK